MTNIPFIRRVLAVAIAIILSHAGLSPLCAKEPVASTVTDLPNLSEQTGNPVLAGFNGRPIVLQGNKVWRLSDDSRKWEPLSSDALRDLGAIAAAVSDGQNTVLISEVLNGQVILTQLDVETSTLTTEKIPTLPENLQGIRGAIDDNILWIAGIASDGNPRLFERPLDGSRQWKTISAWPAGEALQALGAQNSGVFVTLADGKQWRWLPKKGWRMGEQAPGKVVAGSTRAIGQAHLLYLVEQSHGAALYSYSTITDAWAQLKTPRTLQPRIATSFGDGLLVAENDSDAVLSFASISLQVERQSLALLDWLIVGIYMFGMLAVGFYFYRGTKNGSSNEFFLGSRSIPFWAAGISMFAGSISSISYLAIPAKAFETNWEYIMSKITTIMGLIFVAIWVVPLFRRLNLVSVFNYLELRFHPTIRLLSSALWMLMQIGGRMGIVLFLPAMAIGTITDTNVVACIVAVGIFTIIYTALGGMKAVIWTDVFQVLVLTAGAVFAIGFIIYNLGFTSILDTAKEFDKTNMVNLSFDVTEPTIFGFMILVLFDVVLTFPKDQVLMQRVLATPTEKEASRSVWVFAVVLLPSAFMFYTLFAYYRENPGQLNPLLPIDAVFPAFIGTELPAGITGLIIAGLIAAAMGTLSGIINSVATLLSVDFYGRFRQPTQKQTVRFAEWMSVVVGVVGIAIAVILSRLDIHSLLDLTIELFGLLGGSCAGAYTLGMYTTRANWQGVAIGIIAASLLTLVVWIFGLIHPYWYLALAIMASICIGYVASFLFPPPSHSLEGLTVYTGGGRTARDTPNSVEMTSSKSIS